MESSPLKRLYDLANIILLLLVAYTAYAAYPRLPARMPSHFDFAGNPDGWSGRSGVIVLAAVPWLLTIVFYVIGRLIPKSGRSAKNLNIPHKEEFLKLPAEKQMVYWALLREFFAGLTAAVNLLFYLILRGTLRVALGEATLLTFRSMLPALVVLALIMIVYFKKMFTLPGRLVRGEE